MHIFRSLPALFAASIVAAGASHAQAAATAQGNTTNAMSLDDAVQLALGRSDAVTIARAGAARAHGQVLEAVSGWWPQLNGNASYVRTLNSQYQALVGQNAFSPSPNSRNIALCTVQLDSNATATQRANALAEAQSCLNSGPFNGINFAAVGFGAANAYNLGLSLSQTLFNGQVLAASQAASAPRKSADIELTAQRAQVMYDAAQAYYDAALADELVTIADSTYAQSQATYEQTSLGRHVGTQSDYDLLQARVTRDNQLPIVLQRRNDRDLAYYKLKQLLKLPLDQPLQLTTPVEGATSLPGGVQLSALSATMTSDSTVSIDSVAMPVADTAVDRRSSVREQQLTVTEYQALKRQANFEYAPTVTLQSAYARVAYPTGGLPAWSSFLQNWTVGVYASVPIFNGFRTHGDVVVANANLMEQRARLDQERQLAALDSRTAIANFRQAEAAWVATTGSVAQATRAYQIAGLRYREGLSTLVELNDSRLSEQQALANRAQAARNLQVARVKLALLRDLPVSATVGSAGASAQESASQGSASIPVPAPSPAPNTTATGGVPGAQTTGQPATSGGGYTP